MREHHIGVSRTARYFTLGNSSSGVGEVWFACHGYGQVASRFLEKLRVLDDGHRYLVAPEGLSRFYLSESPTERRVGASWMTREDRLAEIEDYVRYLDAVYAAVFESLDRAGVTVHALGYSQGASTVSRWAALGKAKIDRLTLWGDRKSTRLNSSHSQISYAVFCLKKKKNSSTRNLYENVPQLCTSLPPLP